MIISITGYPRKGSSPELQDDITMFVKVYCINIWKCVDLLEL